MRNPLYTAFFFSNDTATTEIYTLSLHDALPISFSARARAAACAASRAGWRSSARGWSIRACCRTSATIRGSRSEEHTSELQSRPHLVCRLLLEKKKKIAASDYERAAYMPCK